MDIDDDGSQGADGSVILNGNVLLALRTGKDKDPRHVRVPVSLQATNTLVVRLTGKPGSRLRIAILGGTKTIGPGGGEVRTPGQNAIVKIPSGALASDIEISVSEGVPGTALPPLMPGTPLRSISLQPHVLTFAQPVTLAWSIQQLGLSEGALDRIRFVHLTRDGQGAWTEPADIDVNTSTFSVQLTSFSSGLLTSSTTIQPPGTFSVIGMKWVPSLLRWSVLSKAGTFSVLNNAQWTAAFQQWADQTHIQFVYEPDPTQAQIVVQEVDVLSGTLPSACDNVGVIYDWIADATAGVTCLPWRWSLMSDLTTADKIPVFLAAQTVIDIAIAYGLSIDDLAFKIARHEIGHALGIDHPARTRTADPAIMHQMSQGSFGRPGLADWDINAIQALYGVPTLLAPILHAPPNGYGVQQNNPATGVPYDPGYGYGWVVQFDWSDVPGAALYQVELLGVGAVTPIHIPLVTSSEYRLSYPTAFAADGAIFRWRVRAIAGSTMGPWSSHRDLVFGSCILNDGTPCGTPHIRVKVNTTGSNLPTQPYFAILDVGGPNPPVNPVSINGFVDSPLLPLKQRTR